MDNPWITPFYSLLNEPRFTGANENKKAEVFSFELRYFGSQVYDHSIS
jgi:hypothetical protein